MDIFSTFKNRLKQSKIFQKPGKGLEGEVIAVIEGSDNWDSLETRLIELRTLNRKRQQEIFERLGPLAERVEECVSRANESKFRIARQHLLRQAEELMLELDAEDEPSKLYSMNTQMLTRMVVQVRKAAAMSERGIEPHTIDAMSSGLEDIVVQYQLVRDAAADMSEAVEFDTVEMQEPAEPGLRLAEILRSVSADTPLAEDSSQEDRDSDSIVERLYEKQVSA